MKIGITGANGFIGSHVVEECLSRGYEVSVFDKYFKEVPKGVKFFLGDIRDRSAVFEFVGLQDAVINLAGVLGTSEAVANPYPSVEVNILGGLNFLEACRYGNVRGVQIANGNYFMNNTYSITKNSIERFALMYNKEHGTKVAVVRGLSVYGEGQKHKPIRKIAPNFICKALRGEPIVIFGTGESVQDQVYVKDVARILVEAATNENVKYDKVYEAGTGVRTNVNQVAELVNRLTGNKAEIQHIPMRAGEDDNSIILGNPETLTELNLPPLTKIEDGYKTIIKWYSENYPWQKD